MSQKLSDIVSAGVVTGDDVQKIFAFCKAHNMALPAVNVISSDSINAVIEAAAKAQSAVIVQFSNGGAQFVAGKGLKLDGQQAAILGAISGAQHVHAVAKHYGVPVILHTDHAAKKLLPRWWGSMCSYGGPAGTLLRDALFIKSGRPASMCRPSGGPTKVLAAVRGEMFLVLSKRWMG